MKTYNAQTQGYKIDIYVDGKYWCTTDMFKTLKRAVSHAVEYWPKTSKVSAKFN